MKAALQLLRSPNARALLPLVVVLILGAIFHQNGAFFEWNTHRSMLREISVHGILGCGMTIVIIAAGIDLSVGSLLGLAAVSMAFLSMPLAVPGGVAVLGVLALGLLAGSVSGLLVAVSKIQAFVVTLAMMVFARGLAKQISGGKKISNYMLDAQGRSVTLDYPGVFTFLDGKIFGDNLAVVSVVFALTAVVTYLILDKLRAGRYLYAVGGNIEAARLAGVPVRRTLVFAYAVSGLFAAVAGICQAAQETHGDPETGFGYELDAIAMVVLGGTSLMGGKGGVGRTVVGALTLGYLQKILSLNAFSTEARLMLTGVIIVGAVLFQRRFSDT